MTFVGIVDECAELGVTCATLYSAGFSESGPQGAELEAQIVATAQRCEMLISGPNGLGWLNFHGRSAMYAGWSVSV